MIYGHPGIKLPKLNILATKCLERLGTFKLFYVCISKKEMKDNLCNINFITIKINKRIALNTHKSSSNKKKQ